MNIEGQALVESMRRELGWKTRDLEGGMTCFRAHSGIGIEIVNSCAAIDQDLGPRVVIQRIRQGRNKESNFSLCHPRKG